MTVASVNRAIRAVEEALPPLARTLLDMPPHRLAEWAAWREASRAWHAAHPDAYAQWLAGEVEPPSPPVGLFRPAPVVARGDDAAAAWVDMLEGGVA